VKNINILSRKYSGPQKYLERREGGMGEGKRGRGVGMQRNGGNIYFRPTGKPSRSRESAN
jgi:hypothetical protein